MVQYEMYFTNEYIEEILYDLAGVMKLTLKKEKIDKAMNERNKNSLNNLFLLRKDENIICIDCNDKDWIFPLVVICQEIYADVVKKTMLKWDNLIREEYAQELTEDIRDVYGKKNTLLKRIQEYYGESII